MSDSVFKTFFMIPRLGDGNNNFKTNNRSKYPFFMIPRLGDGNPVQEPDCEI